jgi:hypothetical protein
MPDRLFACRKHSQAQNLTSSRRSRVANYTNEIGIYQNGATSYVDTP